jgi:hypothetical protein
VVAVCRCMVSLVDCLVLSRTIPRSCLHLRGHSTHFTSAPPVNCAFSFEGRLQQATCGMLHL